MILFCLYSLHFTITLLHSLNHQKATSTCPLFYEYNTHMQSVWENSLSSTVCSVSSFIYSVKCTFLTFTVVPPASGVFCLSQASDRPDSSWQFYHTFVMSARYWMDGCFQRLEAAGLPVSFHMSKGKTRFIQPGPTKNFLSCELDSSSLT